MTIPHIIKKEKEQDDKIGILIEHTEEQIHSLEVHGIRLNADKMLEYFNGTEWVELKGGGGGNIPLGNVLDLNIEALLGNKIKISWRDPSDVEIEGIVLAKWGGTQLRRKLSSYPMDEKDGQLITNNMVRNQYVNGYIDKGLVDGEKYYYALFPYTVDNSFTVDVANRVSEVAFNKYIKLPPSKPTVSGLNSLRATISSDVGSVVSLDKVNWFNSPHEFTGLVLDRSYTPYAKFEEDMEYNESAIVEGDSFIALDKLPQSAPTPPDISNLAFDRVTVTGIANTEVKLGDGEWLNSPQTYTGLTAETEYRVYARMKETETKFASDSSTPNIFTTPKERQLYGVKIDTNNSNPKAAVTYIEDSIGFTEAFCNNGVWQMGGWEGKFPFNQIKPCLVKNGVVNYYLNPNDYTKKLDGGASDITSGNDGDVMVEFPKIFWKFERIGSDLYIRYSDVKVDSGYKCLAHTVGSVEKDFIYLSAYKGYEVGGKLRSLSGKMPTVNKTISQFRSIAQANGSEYQQFSYYPMLMLQVLALIMGKNRDTQTSLGRGWVDGNSGATSTGVTNTEGLFYGETTGKKQMKFCGVEDFYGNVFDWVDGLFSDSNWNIMIGDQMIFNDNGSGYVNHGRGASANLNGWVGDVQGGTETGFIVKTTNGSATTHYSDHGQLYGGRLARFGGNWSDGDSAGAFYLRVNLTASYSNSILGSRLLCFGK